MIRVFLADDHPVMVRGLERLLAGEDDFEVVGVVHDLGDLDAHIPDTVDVLVLDVSMPGMHGAETIERLRTRYAPILLFTLEPESAQVIALLRAGASGVVSKSAHVTVLLDAIRTVARGGRAVPMTLEQRANSGDAWPHDALSEREQAIFQRLVRGVSPKTIAFELGLSVSTVYTYAERVREKLGVTGQVELVDYAHRAGLLGKGSLSR